MAAEKILVFDSGLGGLSILHAVQKALPECHYIYASDNQAFPYGTKTEQFLIQRVQTVLTALISAHAPDLLVIACNTASTLVLPHIRRCFTLPVVGVVPAIKPAAKQTETGVIGLLGTPGTVNRGYTDQLIHDFAHDCDVIRVGSSELVVLAEQSLYGKPPPKEALCHILQPFIENTQLDTIVLACTHFPLLKPHLVANTPRPIMWLDSGQAIARRVANLLTPPRNGASLPPSGMTVFTQAIDDLGPLQSTLNTLNIGHISFLDI